MIRAHVVCPDVMGMIKTNATRKKTCVTVFQLQAKPSYYHYSFYLLTIPLWNAMPTTLVEAESFKVELATQKIPVLINY